MHSPHCSRGNTKALVPQRRRSLLICTLLYYHSRIRLDFTLYNFSLPRPLPTILLSLTRAGLSVQSPTPHLLPSPSSSSLSALPLPFSACLQAREWALESLCILLSRTGRDKLQGIKVNEISQRKQCTIKTYGWAGNRLTHIPACKQFYVTLSWYELVFKGKDDCTFSC